MHKTIFMKDIEAKINISTIIWMEAEGRFQSDSISNSLAHYT